MGERMVDVVGCFFAPLIVGSLVIRTGGKHCRNLLDIRFPWPHNFYLYQVSLPIKVGVHVGFHVDDFPDKLLGVVAGDGFAIKKERLLFSWQVVGPGQKAVGRQQVQVVLPILGPGVEEEVESVDYISAGPRFVFPER